LLFTCTPGGVLGSVGQLLIDQNPPHKTTVRCSNYWAESHYGSERK